jgi:glycosyltransferase involved in cell wall biosynthesis
VTRSLLAVPARHAALNLAYLVPGETGGMEVYARRLIPALRAERPELALTAIVAQELASELRERQWCEGLRVVALPVPGRSRPRRVLAEQLLVARTARRAGADVLHSLASTGPVVTGALASVLTVHDVIYASHPETHAGLLRYGMAALVPASARAADRVVADSAYTASELVARLHVARDKIDVVPLGPGSDPSVAPTPEPELRARLGLGDDPLVLSVSARRPHKNLERLIDAVKALDEPATLVLPGYPGPHDAALAARGGERVRVLGWVSDADLEGLYATATCLAFPSLAEGFGLPVLEAMRRGVPVACSNLTSLPEVAGDAALLFDPLSVADIATALARLLGDGALRDDLAARGRRQAAGFSWARTARGTLAVYDAAVGRGGG